MAKQRLAAVQHLFDWLVIGHVIQSNPSHSVRGRTFAATREPLPITAMLTSASDAKFTDIETVNFTLVTVIFGAVRNAFERSLTATEIAGLKFQLKAMCRAYLQETAAQMEPNVGRRE